METKDIKKELLTRLNELDKQYTDIVKEMLKDYKNKDFNLGLFTNMENLRKQNLISLFNANTYLVEIDNKAKLDIKNN